MSFEINGAIRDDKIGEERERERIRENTERVILYSHERDFASRLTSMTKTTPSTRSKKAKSSKVDLWWVQPGVNVLIESGDDDKPFVAKVKHVDTAKQRAKVRTMKNGRRSVVSEKPVTEHCVLTCRLLALLSC